MSKDVAIRPATDRDREIRFRVYCDDRADEMSLVDWSAGQRDTFLQMQFDIRERAYNMQFPGLTIEVIEADGRTVGQMLTVERAHEILLVDIALLSENRSRGIGAMAIEQLIMRAQKAGKKLVLRVDKANTRAQRFYERSGFKVTTENQLQFQMEYCI